MLSKHKVQVHRTSEREQKPSAARGLSQLLPTFADHLEYCERVFSLARTASATLVRLSVPAPSAPLLCQPEGSMLWCPPQADWQLIGSGQAATLRASGKSRFDDIKQAAIDLWEGLFDSPYSGSTPSSPRLFGGLSFAAHAPQSEWKDFGQALFWLPRKLYGKNKGQSILSLCASINESPHAVAQELHQAQQSLLVSSSVAPKQAQIDCSEHLSADTWESRIEDIRTRIATGTVHKIVAARSSRLHFKNGIELRPALERLSDRYQDCYRFAFQPPSVHLESSQSVGDATFLGASPETLIDKQGLKVRTHAMAGSIAADAPDADARLLASSKDRHEQDLVTRAITAALAKHCSEVECSETPETRTLRHVTHLCTPITGKLARPVHVLDLVADLHPTPAVGGSPGQEAMSWIADNEENRGWYAGPVGWFDSRGDGNFAVAIRSALFSGNEALVYAGAGIVADSDPQQEYQETGLKQRAILDALGIVLGNAQ